MAQQRTGNKMGQGGCCSNTISKGLLVIVCCVHTQVFLFIIIKKRYSNKKQNQESIMTNFAKIFLYLM